MEVRATTTPGPDRVLALEGADNFRDLGGYPTVDGGQVRWGHVFRSDALHRLTPADLTALAPLGLRVVYDLRGEEERTRAPSLLPEGVRCEWLPIGGTAAQTKELTDLVVAGRLGEVPVDFLERIYVAMAEMAAPTFGRLLNGLAEVDGLPALIHCTAGKDRTGMSAALLLSVLGVDEATILDDYELSRVHYTDRNLERIRPRLAEAGIADEHYRVVFGAPRSAMARLLASLRDRYGSVEGYLENEAGVAPDVFPELRARLVDRADGEGRDEIGGPGGHSGRSGGLDAGAWGARVVRGGRDEIGGPGHGGDRGGRGDGGDRGGRADGGDGGGRGGRGDVGRGGLGDGGERGAGDEDEGEVRVGG